MEAIWQLATPGGGLANPNLTLPQMGRIRPI